MGKVTATVRRELWETVTSNVADGRCILVYPYANEQGWAVQTHNALSRFMDFDGFVLPLKPSMELLADEHRRQRGREVSALRQGRPNMEGQKAVRNFEIPPSYVVIDIETTGLDVKQDEIIEIAAVRVQDGVVIDTFCELVSAHRRITRMISKMTGITDDMLVQQGKPLDTVMPQLFRFVSSDIIVGYNISFDMKFLNRALFIVNGEVFKNREIDVLRLAKKYLKGLKTYKLSSVCEILAIDYNTIHRAAEDAALCDEVFRKLSTFDT